MSRVKSVISRADWLEHVSTWRTSGLTQAAYCRDHQLNATTFNGWILRGRVNSPATVPLTTVPIAIEPGPASPSALSIVLQHGSGWQLTLPKDVRITWLVQLLKELA
jgi:hypothetical protein